MSMALGLNGSGRGNNNGNGNGYGNNASTTSSLEVDNAPVKRRRSQRNMMFNKHPTRPQTASATASGPSSPILYNTPQIPHSLHKRPSEASRLRALNNGYRSHSSDGRHTPESGLESFSRPRQSSLRRRNNSPKPLTHGATFPLQAHDEEQTTPAQRPVARDRGLSGSSIISVASFIPSHKLRPSVSIPDFQTADSIYSRQRNLNNSNYRPVRRPDSTYSSHTREPIARPTGFDEEEVRTSFRSALTTNSSLLGTSGTERSSVMTKSSSATSIFGRDEGMSVDDAIGMYEGGFQDSGTEDNYGPPEPNSEQGRASRLSEAMNDSLSVPSGAIIRDSAAIFESGISYPPSLGESTRSSGQDGTLDIQESYFDGPAPSRPAPSPPSTKDDGTRDRYGFRKATANVPIDKYEAWNGPYTEYLARRRKKWVALLKDNNLITDDPFRFPPQSTKVRRFVRKGIPPDWRGAAWFYYAGGPAMVSKHYGVYADLVKKAAAGGVNETDDEIIERDLNRTFPDNIRFKPDTPPGRDSHAGPEVETPMLQALRRVLQAFSIFNPKIGYCQSLNFLAGLLLLFMEEEKAFWMLNIITRVYLPGTHEVNLEGVNVDLGVLMISIKSMMPQIWAKIGGELDGSDGDGKVSMRLPPVTLCATAWFMSCFIGTLPIETTLRVWDSFFYEGSKTLFRIALAIFKVGEQEIKAVSDPMEIFQVVQTIPRRLIDASALMDACFRRRNGFGNLSQETIEKLRAQRRKGYADERERDRQIAAGIVPDGAGRKGTAFKIKKRLL
ncbi:GTPase-activating protein [Lachnellula occidentalis]|uniref:GTPase-activating protein n=1 Tax=Lachnellula occidentalis TaxID=215460 RepID=A0A8H8RJK3_9HELO|nr:GTPase-activating protein [Lachnellula occidentalis]